MQQLCRHVQTNGARCRQLALRSQPLCYYHQNRQPRRRRSILQPQTQFQTQLQTLDYGSIPVTQPEICEPIQVLFPEDRASIQINLFRVLEALASNRIDLRTANSMTYNIQVSMSNLAHKPLIESQPANAPESAAAPIVQRIILTPEGDELAPPTEILEENEATPIHHPLCPCLQCAEQHRNWPGEAHHPECQCGLCEPIAASQTSQSESTQQPQLLTPQSLDVPGTNPEAQPRIARAASLLSESSGSVAQDPLNRPWSVAEYTFGDKVRRHEAQYAARAAAALAAGIEPPPYQPFATGLVDPAGREGMEDKLIQDRANEYWAQHFRAQLAQRPAQSLPLNDEDEGENEIDRIQARAEEIRRSRIAAPRLVS
jgi:hypothetical protein